MYILIRDLLATGKAAESAVVRVNVQAFKDSPVGGERRLAYNLDWLWVWQLPEYGFDGPAVAIAWE